MNYCGASVLASTTIGHSASFISSYHSWLEIVWTVETVLRKKMFALPHSVHSKVQTIIPRNFLAAQIIERTVTLIIEK